MKYYILANNTQLTQESIEKIDLDGDNILVLFNYLWPLRFKEILDYDNKICISRKFAIPQDTNERYANIDNISINRDLFKTIYLHPHPSHMQEPQKSQYQKYIDRYNFQNVGILDQDLTNIRSKIGYPLGKNISTGIIVYEYLRETKNSDDQIVLVGFDSNVSQKFHNAQWEKLYMLHQINLNQCSFIQSYGLNERL